MKDIEVVIYTTVDIKGRDVGERLFRLLERLSLIPERIGHTEPLRSPYNFDTAVDLWLHEDTGGTVGAVGGIIAKARSPRFFIQSMWSDFPDRLNLNWVGLNIAEAGFKKYSREILIFFEEAIEILHACYGYIAPDITVYRQHVTGRLDTRLPGVFWFNYFGQPYVEFFTKEKLTAYPWHSIQETEAGGLVTSLADEYTVFLESDEYEKKAKAFLGSSSFGDVEEHLKNPRNIQMRDVPEL